MLVYQAQSEGKRCMMKKKTTMWYTRQNGTVSGPFSTAVINNNILLDRLSDFDEVSSDQQTWQLILNIPELNTKFNNDEEERAKRNLDERDGFDRRQLHEPPSEEIMQQRRQERRTLEDENDIEYRQLRTLLLKRYRQHKEQLYWPVVALFIVMLLSLILAVIFPTQLPMPQPNCEMPIGPNINWSNCSKLKQDFNNQDLSGAQLRNSKLIGSNFLNTSFIGTDLAYADLRFTDMSYSQLQNSSLLGANLQKADLSYANLANADLSYADLTSANLGASKLDNAIFDNAIWPDGTTCALGSIGQCIAISQ